MDMKNARGAQVGNNNTQNNTYPSKPAYLPAIASEDSSATSIATGDHSIVANAQKKTNFKFSIPFFGPLLATAARHPMIAGIAAAVFVSGASIGGTVLARPDTSHASQPGAALPASQSAVVPLNARSAEPSTSPAAAVPLQTGPASPTASRAATANAPGLGFRMLSHSHGGPQFGYDFSQMPPVAARSEATGISVSGGMFLFELISSNSRITRYEGRELPTADDCKNSVKDTPMSWAYASPGNLYCYTDQFGNPGYILVRDMDSESLTVDTVRLSDPDQASRSSSSSPTSAVAR